MASQQHRSRKNIKTRQEPKQPPHPGIFVKAAMDDLGLSINAFARKLDVSPATVQRLVVGKANLSPEMAVRLSMTIGEAAQLWMLRQAEYDLHIARNHVDVSQLERLRQ